MAWGPAGGCGMACGPAGRCCMYSTILFGEYGGRAPISKSFFAIFMNVLIFASFLLFPLSSSSYTKRKNEMYKVLKLNY
jgi:hypothetical protein